VTLKKIPNFLTVLRILLTPLIIATFYISDPKVSGYTGASLFALAALTDFLDGYLARKWNIQSNFGKVFDSIADKILLSGVLIMFVKHGKAHAIPCIIIIVREILVSGMRQYTGSSNLIKVSYLGKVKAFLQMLTSLLIFLGEDVTGLRIIENLGQCGIWVAAALTVITGYQYFSVFIKHKT
jgi:CDP-diacylglycerol--glycerol-3-phosphate 3-phosphatidyltransferase